jgi:hypothetical protein
MDFSKPARGLVTPYFPRKNAAPDEGDVPAGADWFAWDLTIGPSDGGHSSPNPMSPAQSDPMPSLLASTLHWSVPSCASASNPFDFMSGGGSALEPVLGQPKSLSWKTATPSTRKPERNGLFSRLHLAEVLSWDVSHPQVPVCINRKTVLIDQGISELIGLMNRVEIQTICSCSGSGESGRSGYVLMTLPSALRLLRLWRLNQNAIGREPPGLEDLKIRDRGWIREIDSEFPLVRPLSIDEEGTLFVAVWRFSEGELRQVSESLCRVLKGERAAR